MPENFEPNSRRAPLAGASPDASSGAAAAVEWFARRDAGLSAEQLLEFQKWLAADPAHRAALARLESAWSVFGKPVRTGAADELMLELSSRATRRWHRRLGAAAATAAILMTLGAFWRLPRHPEPLAARPATATVRVPARQLLPDGSVIILKEGAQVAESFTTALRRVELKQGQAIFEVVKDSSRPFVVTAGGVDVRAVGTAFSVELGGSAVEVLVTEGRVAVDKRPSGNSLPAGPTAGDRDQDAGRREQMAEAVWPAQGPAAPSTDPSPDLAHPAAASVVDAGQRIVVEIASNVPMAKATPMAPAELDERLAWRKRRVEFSGTPLAEAVALLNREIDGQPGMKLVISDPFLAAMRVSGIFRTDNLEAFVLLLEAGFGVKAEWTEGAITLRRAAVSPN